MTCRRIILLAAAALWTAEAVAQSTRVRGRVTDASTGLPLQFASVVFSGTTVGITTDEQGIYALETRDTTARIEVSIVGYAPQSRRVERGTFSQVDFALDPVRFDIGQVVITPGDNPAHPILEEVVRRRPQNDPEYYDTYCCTTYTKMELDLTNLRPSFRSKRLQRNFGFIFSYMDTSALTGAAYLPAMISESSAELYHSRSPQFTREVIRASRISGVENSEAVAQFTGGMHGDVNFYDNFIDLFDVRFASPLASGGRTYYDYFLVDSLDVKGRKTYKIRFHPKRLTTPVLDGEIHIDSATYALQSASVRMPRGVNVNWIRHLRIDNENRLTENGRWFRLRDRVSAEFSLTTADSSKLVSFIGTREIAYSDVRIDEPIPDEVLRMDNRVQIAGGNPNRRDEAYWEAVRPYTLSERERGIYAMVDSVQRVPLYRNIYTLVNTILVGHWNTKYIGIGPYYKIASFNKLEGFRMQLGGRTTTEVSRRVPFGIRRLRHARRTLQGRRQHRGGFRPHADPQLTLSGRHDVLQLGAGDNALTESNILLVDLSRGDQRLDGEPGRGGLRARMATRRHGLPRRPPATGLFQPLRPDDPPGRHARQLHLRRRRRAELRFFAKDETVYRMPLRQTVARFEIPRRDAFRRDRDSRLLPGASEYYRFEGGIRYRPELPPIGYSTITVRGGHIVGTVPYPLSKLHEGNGTYFYDPYAFSCMDYYEFALRQLGGVVLRTPFQRSAAGPPASSKNSAGAKCSSSRASGARSRTATTGRGPEAAHRSSSPQACPRSRRPTSRRASAWRTSSACCASTASGG